MLMMKTKTIIIARIVVTILQNIRFVIIEKDMEI